MNTTQLFRHSAKACLLAASLACSTLAHAQAGTGLTLNLDDKNPLSQWGRWTYIDQSGPGWGLKLNQDRGHIPLTANWRQGDWVFKLSKDALNDQHDLFFGLRLSEDALQSTSLGCMSNRKKNSLYATEMCGVRMDVNLK
ncbi:hypothetical protein NQT62_01630 [Limnobacter humi]|uniref:Uncharacterized protein n=1 Tax=Limnobacter humi TaxID=1778671 RepID=A0ABT1WC92_9BURK|nr:hypothetical protein [Limnobacter humi]MCQ8895136.1 hypothetical protein [Limnobacter humi]